MTDGTITIDSNQVGFYLAQEETLGVLPATPKWRQMQPNSYGDFGAEYVTVSRAPINASRQNKKGKVVDLNASMNFESDFLAGSLYDPLQGYMYAAWDEKAILSPTAVTATQFTVANTLFVGALVFAKGFANDANNGLKLVTARTATSVTVGGLVVEASPPSDATLTLVGAEAGAGGGIKFVSDSTGMKLTSTGANAVDFTNLINRRGEWVYIGGDAANSSFTDAAVNGWARAKAVPTAGELKLDAVSGAPSSNTASGKKVRLFIGSFIRNESQSNDIICKSYQGERSLGAAGYEYVIGGLPNTLETSMGLAEIIKSSLSFVALKAEDRTSAQGAKAGDRIENGNDVAFNTTTDLVRIRLRDDVGGELNGTSYATDMSLSVNNNVTVRKALGYLGGVAAVSGDFVVTGQATFYFSDNAPVTAIRTNADVGLDYGLVAENQGMYFDVPLVTLGDGRKNVEKDQPILLPLSYNAAESDGGYTLSITHFPYLPTAAMPDL